MFYFLNLIFALYGWFLYAVFRSSIYDYLRISKVSKTYIRKSRKGFMNNWFYLQIHREHSIGILFYWNILFFFSIILYSIIAILLGCLDFLKIPIIALSIMVCLIEIPSTILAAYKSYQAEFGTPFVLWAKRKGTGKYCSVVIDMLAWMISILLVYLSIQAAYGV